MKKLATFAILLAACTVARAGVVYEIEVLDHEQDTPRSDSTQVEIDGHRLAMEILPSSEDEGRREGKMVFRGDRREVVVVDDDTKSYYVMDEAAVASIGNQVSEIMSQMDEMIKNLPKEQQEAIKRAQEQGVAMPGMPGQMPTRSKPELRKIGDTATKQGYPCVKYEVWQDDRRIRELWVTDWDNLEGADEARGVFREFGEFMQALLDSIPDMPGRGGPAPREGFIDTLAFDAGFPVVTRAFGEDGELDNESLLRSARRQEIDPSAFEPPSGYKRMSMGPR